MLRIKHRDIHRHDRQALRQDVLDLLVEILRLGIAVRMLPSFVDVDIGLEAVARLVQQLPYDASLS